MGVVTSGTVARSRAAFRRLGRRAGTLGATMWCRRRGGKRSARTNLTRSAPAAAVGRRRARRQDRAGRPADGGRPHQKNGGINGRPIEIVVADDEFKPTSTAQGRNCSSRTNRRSCRRPLSNICLACMPVFEDTKVVNMISVCLDTTLTTTKCNRYSFRVHDYAPAQAVAFAPKLVGRWARSGTSPMPTIPGASRRATHMPRNQEGRRRDRRHHRYSAWHRRYDAVPV